MHLNIAQILARFEICAIKLVDSAAGRWVHEWWLMIGRTKQGPWQVLSCPLAWVRVDLERTQLQGFPKLEHLPTVLLANFKDEARHWHMASAKVTGALKWENMILFIFLPFYF